MKTVKTTGIVAAFRSVALAVIGCVAPLAVNAVVPYQDITKFIREAGSGSYSVTLGEGAKQNASYPAANAFDGVTASGDANRVLLAKDHGEPMQFIYTISDSVYPGYGFTVCSMTLFRLRGSDDTTDRNRSPKAFTLEALDGTEWKTLLSVDSQTWGSSTYAKSYDIPVANKGDYRSFRFTITENNDQWWGGVQEIVFDGIVTPNLVWNGMAGASWNATDANWIDGMGAATNWIPGAKATFGARGSAAVIVEGTNEVSGIEFSVANSCIISGGALAIASPGGIKAGKDDVIASEFVDATPVSVLSDNEHLPADPSDKNKGAWTLLWRNRKLSEITGFSDATIDQNGTLRAASAQQYVNNGDTASVQFQYLISGGALLGVKVLLEQNGSDVWGRIAYSKYSYANPHPLGDDLDIDKSDVYFITVRDMVVSTSGYGLYGVTPIGGEITSLPLRVSVGDGTECVSQPSDRYLPKNATNTKTGDAVLRFPGYRLEDLVGIASSDLMYTDKMRPASIHYFTDNVTNVTVQVQGNTSDNGGGAQLSVKVEFTDGEGGVYARAVYAKYDWSNNKVHDFDITWEGEMDIYDETHTGSGGAYGVKNLVAVFCGHRVTFGAPTVVLDREITGDGTVRFAPLSGSQMVTVPVARTLDKVAFGGATTFSFATGASLSVVSAEIEDAAAVNVLGVNLLRVGSSKGLTRDECAHFTVNGSAAAQNDQGWIVQKPGMLIVVQ